MITFIITNKTYKVKEFTPKMMKEYLIMLAVYDDMCESICKKFINRSTNIHLTSDSLTGRCAPKNPTVSRLNSDTFLTPF